MKVKITKLAKNPMQSGRGKKSWLLTMFEERNVRSINELTGWISCDDTKTQIRLKFKTKEDAIKYAQDQRFEYVIDEARESTIQAKSYTSNFTRPI